MWQYNYTDELYHWGVKGMKWGVRRYQNSDGSLTPAGKKRYTDKELEAAGELLKKGGTIASKAAKDIDTSKPKKVRMDLSKMSDEQMRKEINRELLERQYNDLFAPPTKAEKGKRVAKTALTVAGGVMTAGATALSIAVMINQLKSKAG